MQKNMEKQGPLSARMIVRENYGPTYVTVWRERDDKATIWRERDDKGTVWREGHSMAGKT